ncbi:MAG: ankyrin repeat domain-containing protein [Planctomycetia bacterium]|nr:ankyrin repeat domain-containing protein [Planctomycetia bacterium]
MPAKKTCAACGKRLSPAAFNGSSKTADGLARTCRACTNARRRRRERAGDKCPPSHARATVLATALRQGDDKTVRKLLRANMSPHWGWVCETMREGHLPLADFLVESGVERNVFTMAAMGDVNGLTRRLRRVPADARLTAGMEPASDRVTPLHVACSSDWRHLGPERMTAQGQVVEVLVEHGADLRATARYRGIAGATPLFCACWSSGNVALTRWLLERGARATDACLGPQPECRLTCRRWTRLTNAFSKTWKHHEAMFALYVAFYNFVRVHSTIETTPAVAHKLRDHVWSIEELLTATAA